MNPTLLDIPVIPALSIEVYFILLVIAILTFFFWSWLLKKYIKVERKRKFAAWSATLIGTPIIYVGLITLFLFSITYTPSKDFNKQQWLTKKEERFQMAGSIIKSKMLIGKDATQVKQILGNPIWGSDTTKVWIYDMGSGGGGLGFLFHNLIVKLDRNGKVDSVEHIEIQD